MHFNIRSHYEFATDFKNSILAATAVLGIPGDSGLQEISYLRFDAVRTVNTVLRGCGKLQEVDDRGRRLEDQLH